ncbi:MAG TPA: hypothetical protein VF761_07890 [Gemmatimonadaceae bacterium]
MTGVVPRISRALLAALCALALACASGQHHRGTRLAHDPNVITADEISGINAMTAYDVVKRLRPQFLVSRGPTSIADPRPTTPVVYLDGIRYGDVSTLVGIEASRVASIRYISGPEAQQRFGSDNVGGAILVATKQ